jgi:hypothetical protein
MAAPLVAVATAPAPVVLYRLVLCRQEALHWQPKKKKKQQQQQEQLHCRRIADERVYAPIVTYPFTYAESRPKSFQQSHNNNNINDNLASAHRQTYQYGFSRG